MIVYALVDPKNCTTYHTEDHLKDKNEKVSSIKSRSSYNTLKDSIQAKGMLDPVVMRIENEDRSYFVEVGEQRVLSAIELGLTEMPAIAYTAFPDSEILFPYEKELTTMKEIEELFQTVQVLVPVTPENCSNPNCPLLQEHQTIETYVMDKNNLYDPQTERANSLATLESKYTVNEAAGLKTLRDYIEAGIAKF